MFTARNAEPIGISGQLCLGAAVRYNLAPVPPGTAAECDREAGRCCSLFTERTQPAGMGTMGYTHNRHTVFLGQTRSLVDAHRHCRNTHSAAAIDDPGPVLVLVCAGSGCR